MKVRHYLTELDASPIETRDLIDAAKRIKRERKENRTTRDLAGRHVGLYFEKPSVRTRTSFTVAVHELGANVVELSAETTKVKKGEDIEDFARVMSCYVDALVARVFRGNDLVQMARRARMPIINALSDERHPCQALADWMTIEEKFGAPNGLVAAFIGEGNNVAASFATIGAMLGATVRVASPRGRELPADVLSGALDFGGDVLQLHHPREAAAGAHVLYTDTWVSMGQEANAASLRRDLSEYRIDDALLRVADARAVVMHCLPAVRGEEIDEATMYGEQSAIWDQAENRLHVQKALLLWLLGGERDTQNV